MDKESLSLEESEKENSSLLKNCGIPTEEEEKSDKDFIYEDKPAANHEKI
jgi:hypothetical protein